jgi:hypothetical protein
VGKTSLSCAAALKLAESGKRVLLVSTDPASNLDEVLETILTNKPTSIPGAPKLDAMNINPVEAAAAYRERLIGPMRGLLPESALRSMEEQLSAEHRYLREVVEKQSKRTAWLPWQPEEPVGPDSLARLAANVIDGVLLIETAERQRTAGKSLFEAALGAGLSRLRRRLMIALPAVQNAACRPTEA